VGAIRYETRTLGVHLPGHYLFNGVNTLSDYYTSAVPMLNGGVSVGSWDDSTPLIAYNPNNGLVAINAYVGSARQYSGDMIPLLHNAINFSRGFTGIGDDNVKLPGVFALHQNYPNPFNPSTTIAFDLPTKTNVTLDVFNVLGQRVASYPQGMMNAGNHNIVFDGSQMSSGIYFYRLNAGEFSNTRKMVILK
jgi:hypothetical protein